MNQKHKELIQDVVQWGRDKRIKVPIKQTLKTVSEAGEIAEAIENNFLELSIGDFSSVDVNKMHDLIDAIGDTQVCLIILRDILCLDQGIPDMYGKLPKSKSSGYVYRIAFRVLSDIGKLSDAVCKSNLEDYEEILISDTTIDNYTEIVIRIDELEDTLSYFISLLGLEQHAPLEFAYNVISKRKGKIINGTLVKD